MKNPPNTIKKKFWKNPEMNRFYVIIDIDKKRKDPKKGQEEKMGNIQNIEREKNMKVIRLETKKHGVREFKNNEEGIKELEKFILILKKDEKHGNPVIEFLHTEYLTGKYKGITSAEFHFVDELVEKINWIGFKK